MDARTLQVPQLDRTMLRLRSAEQLVPLDFHTSTDHRTVLAVVEHDRVRSAVRCPSFGTSRALGIHSCFKQREESEDADNVCGAVHTTRIVEITDPEGWGEIEQDMGLLQRLKHDLRTGLATLRLGTAQAANRALEETELLRLRLEIRRIDQQLNELFHDVGERAVSLREAGEPVERVLYDTEISRLVKEIHQLKDATKKLEAEMQEIRDAE